MLKKIDVPADSDAVTAEEVEEVLRDVQAFLNNPKALIGRALDLLYAQRDETVVA